MSNNGERCFFLVKNGERCLGVTIVKGFVLKDPLCKKGKEKKRRKDLKHGL